MPSYTSNNALRSGLEAQVNFMTELTRRTYDSVRRLSELNMNFAQQLMQDSVEASRKMLSCSDPFQMAAASAAAAQPAAEHLRHYQQQLTGLLSGSQLELMSRAEQSMQQAGRSGYSAAQEVARNMAQAGESVPGADSHGGNGHAAPHRTFHQN